MPERNRYSRDSGCEFYARPMLMHRGRCLLQQPTAARHMAALADKPHRRPERRRRARDDRNAVPVLKRLGAAERAQAAAGNQDALGVRRLGHRLAAERDDIGLALAARSAEFEEVEAFERE